MEITTGNVPDTVVILRDQVEKLPLCQQLLVMFPAQLKAMGQAKLGPIRPGQAKPKSQPEHGFGPA